MQATRMRLKQRKSLLCSLVATFRYKIINGYVGLSRKHRPRQFLSTGYDFVDGPYPYVTTVQFHDDIAPVIEADSLSEFRRQA
jgi:hypothetical protein